MSARRIGRLTAFAVALALVMSACVTPPPGSTPDNSNANQSTQALPDVPVDNANATAPPPAARLLAKAGDDQSIASGAVVLLSGRASTLPSDGTTVRAMWSQLSGPAVVMQPVQSLDVSLLIEEAGTYEFVLTLAIDAEVASDNVVVTVAAPPGNGTLSGQISVAQISGTTISEAEPNDALDQAHDLGELVPGRRVTVVGHSSADGHDEHDGFRIRTGRMVRIDATIDFDAGESDADLDLLLYDRMSGQFVGRFDGTTTPERATFHVAGGCDVVLRAFRGHADYHLTLIASEVDGAVAELEPNNASGAQQFVGSIAASQQITLRGDATAGADRDDRFTFSSASAASITAWLTFPGGADFDLIVADASLSSSVPTPLARFDSTEAEVERGTFVVAPFSLTEIDVRAFAGAGPWELTLVADATTTTAVQALKPTPLFEESSWKRRESDAAYGAPRSPFAPGELLLNGDDAANDDAIGVLGLRVVDRVAGGPARVAISLPADWSELDCCRRTLAVSECAARCAPAAGAEPNWIRTISREPNDTFYPRQWHYPLLNLPGAWDLTVGSSSVIVAVIDTGITAHPDLAGRTVAGFDFVSNAQAARDGDGRDADPTDPGDLFLGTSSSFHGTHVSGTVCAASNNGNGVAGTAWDVRVMPLRALGRGGGTSFDIVNAVLYAARLSNVSGQLPAQRANIINLSLGGSSSSQAEQNAFDQVRAAGVLVVAAAGNENSSAQSFPAAYRNVLSIGAVDLGRNRAPYSNFGPTLDLMAPGGNTSADANRDGFVDGVLSTWADDSGGSIQFVYGFLQGTSMASPHAAGVAALILSANPALPPEEAETILRQTATDLGATGRDNSFGDGLINARAAVERALGIDGGGNGNTNANANDNGAANANANANNNTNTNSPAEPIPVLGLSRGSIQLGTVVNTDSVAVSNLGTGRLRLTGLVTRTNDLFNWLSASAEPSTDASRDFSRVVIGVNRAALPIGDYTGTVEVRTNGGTLFVQIAMSVEPPPDPRPPDVNLVVRLIDTRTDATVRTAVVNPRSSDRFRFADVPAGTYYIIAGSDLDGDGAVCEARDFCGAYPIRGLPSPIRVAGVTVLDALDFAVSITDLEPAGP